VASLPSLRRVDAIEDVYNRRYAGFCRGAAALVGRDLAHDVVQEGFARALRRRRQFAGSGTLDGWVWRIIVRAAIDARRRPSSYQSDWPSTEAYESDRDPELVAAIRSLPERRRLVVFLRYFADLSYSEIADACSMAEGTVAATLAQAHADIKDALAASGVT
jgi:RNA polymerase sigma factor (sigma-70 family)